MLTLHNPSSLITWKKGWLKVLFLLCGARNLLCFITYLAGTDILNLTAVAQPAKFHALSGFFFVYNKLNLSPRTNLTMVWESAKQICLHVWSGFSIDSNNPDYAGQFCFQVAYMASLIDYGLCFGMLKWYLAQVTFRGL